jgi:hypothetical protein
MNRLIALLVITLAACAPRTEPGPDEGGAGGFAELTVTPATARAGGVVELTLTNRSSQSLGYNLCPASLEERDGGSWRLRPEPLVEACTMELRTLDPGTAASFSHTLPMALPPGTYRMRTRVEWPLGGQAHGVPSSSFEVTG